MTAAQLLVLFLAIAAANFPFWSERLFLVLVSKKGKSLGFRLLEMLTGYLLVGFLSLFLESRAHGSAYPQHWEFYATTSCLFLVLAFPGFALRYLWRHRAQ